MMGPTSLGLALVLVCGSLTIPIAPQDGPGADGATGRCIGLADLADPPFTANLGQASDGSVVFHSDNALFTRTGVSFRVAAEPAAAVRPAGGPPGPRGGGLSAFSVFRMGFGGTGGVTPEGRDRLAYDSSYFIGNDPSRWATGVPVFRELVYPGLYDGIDLVFRQVPGGLKYEYRLAPGARLADIRTVYEGAALSTDGHDLYIRTPAGVVRDGGLFAYQPLAGGARPVAARMVVEGNAVSYRATYDPRFPLVIDPMIGSTFLGGKGNDYGTSIALDPSGNSYVAGYLQSFDFPTTPGAYRTSNSGNIDIFVTKLNTNLSGLAFSTYIGGALSDYACAIALDPAGNVCLAGFTQSTDFPTTAGALDATFNGTNDGYFLVLDSQGAMLRYSTFIGGRDYDSLSGMAVDASGAAYLTGASASSDFPTTAGAYDTTLNGGYDAVVLKLNWSAPALLYSTFIGRGNSDQAVSIAPEGSGAAYVIGSTSASDFPVTAGAYDTTYNGGNSDIFLLKLNAAGSSLLYGTFLGGGANDGLSPFNAALALDRSANVWAAGYTDSTDFPVTADAFDPHCNGSRDGFVLGLDSQLSTLRFSSYLGGRGDGDWVSSMAVDSSGAVCLAGRTDSSDFPVTSGAFDTSLSGMDGFFARLNKTTGGLLYCTLFGGEGYDYPYCLAVDSSDRPRIAGYTASKDFPTSKGAYDATYNGEADVFVCNIGPTAPFPPRNLTARPGDGFVALGWSPPASDGDFPILNYSVYRSSQPGPLSVIGVLGTGRTYNDTNVTNGVRYSYSVSATNRMGEGPGCSAVKATPGGPPGPPRNLTAAAGDGRIALEWLPPDDVKGFAVAGYAVFRESNASGQSLLASLGNQTSHDDAGLDNGVEYRYFVRAVNARGQGPPSENASGVPGRPPSAPFNLTASAGTGEVRLRWEPPADDGGLPVGTYTVYGGSDPGGLAPLGNVALPGFTHSPLENGLDHYYAVSAGNARGEGGRSCIVSARPGGPPGAPALTAVPGTGVIHLCWTLQDDGGSSIIFFRLLKGTQEGDLQVRANLTLTRWDDTEVARGVGYCYSVSAVNRLGEGPGSPVVAARAVFGEGPPGPPVRLAAAAGNGSVSLSWSPPLETGGPNITGYRVYRWVRPDRPAPLAETAAPAFIDRQAVIGVTYNYHVTALNPLGEGPESGPVSARLSGEGTPPSPPAGLTAAAGDRHVMLAWQLPEDFGGLEVTTYRLYRGAAEGPPEPYRLVLGLSYNDTEVQNGRDYLYAVAAVNLKGESGQGRLVSARPAGLPGPVSNLTCTPGDRFVGLAWERPPEDGGLPITGYRVYRNASGGGFSLLADVGDESYTDTLLENGLACSYRVAATNALGEGRFSQSFAVPGAPPGPPRNLQARSSGMAIALSWDTPGSSGGFPVSGYRIYRASREGSPELLGFTRQNEFRDGSAEPGVHYLYRVSAVGPAGEGPSAEAGAKVPAGKTAGISAWYALPPVFLAVSGALIWMALVRKPKNPLPPVQTEPAAGGGPADGAETAPGPGGGGP